MKYLVSYIIIVVFTVIGIFSIAKQTTQNDLHDFLFSEDVVIKVEDKEVAPVMEHTLPETSEKVVVEEITEPGEDSIIFIANVPFTPQAPLAEWSDPRQQDGCEEASVLMAMRWINGETLNASIAKEEIIKMSKWQEENHTTYIDTSARDTADWLVSEYFAHDAVEVKYDIKVIDIINELSKGNLVLVPAQGQRLFNPYFTLPGPERHMLLIRGYDPATAEFITNDPGTRRGEEYRYQADVLINAIEDYPTGNHLPNTETNKAMIIISK